MCVLSTWFGDINFVAVERTFVCFTKGHDHFFQILFVAAAYEMTNVISRACKQKCTRNWPPPPARRRRTVPCDLCRARLPVPPVPPIFL